MHQLLLETEQTENKITPNNTSGSVSILTGDSRTLLSSLPSEHFQACITSPPYWGLRDYDISNQIGAEMDMHEYIANIVAIFREIKRVLKEDGTVWLNIGDTYTSGGRTWRAPDSKNPARGMSYRAPTPKNLKPKDLIGIPWRLAFALQEDGWYLRSDIVWYKPNCQPESVKDRPVKSHEYIFLLSKSENYFYDSEAAKEFTASGKRRNRRTVWQINTEPYKGSHSAVFPPKLVELCILTATRPMDAVLDPFFGSGTVGLVAKSLSRECTGIELNPEYVELAQKRIGL